MFPLIRDDEAVLVRHVPPETLCRGDIVVFSDDAGKTVCHRLLELESRAGALWLRTRGDNCREPDAAVPARALLGKAIAVKRANRVVPLDSRRARWEGWGIRMKTAAIGVSRALLRRRKTQRKSEAEGR